jgi:hypothetical protein
MSDTSHDAVEAVEAQLRFAADTITPGYVADMLFALRTERDAARAEVERLREAAEMAERRLTQRAIERQAELGPGEAREWERAVWAAFADVRVALGERQP